MSIATEISDAIASCAVRSGKKATRIYLGKAQLDALCDMAKTGTIKDIKPAVDGKPPVVMGCEIIRVSEDSHCYAV